MKKPPRLIRSDAPSMMVAANFLRDIAKRVGQKVADPKTRAADLRLIADCIEGNVKWRKSPKHPFDVKLLINLAAYRVEHRQPGRSVDSALDVQARLLAKHLGRSSAEAEQELRSDIAQARRVRRRLLGPGK